MMTSDLVERRILTNEEVVVRETPFDQKSFLSKANCSDCVRRLVTNEKGSRT